MRISMEFVRRGRMFQSLREFSEIMEIFREVDGESYYFPLRYEGGAITCRKISLCSTYLNIF